MRQTIREITARWSADGQILPQRFTWNGQPVQVLDTGRAWRDEQGYHVLCNGAGLGVLELVLDARGEWSGSAPSQVNAA
jgi:hypothetical protein